MYIPRIVLKKKFKMLSQIIHYYIFFYMKESARGRVAALPTRNFLSLVRSYKSALIFLCESSHINQL